MKVEIPKWLSKLLPSKERPYRRPRSYSGIALAMLTNKAPGMNRISRRKRSHLLPVLAQSSVTESSRITLNVSGRRFETDRWTLRTFADTRLAWMATNPTAHQEYDSIRNEFIIDRHAGCFEFILNFYRTGKLHMPTDVCGPLFEDELNYWGIDERLMEPCCWSRYKTYRDTEDRMRKMLHETQQPFGGSDMSSSGDGASTGSDGAAGGGAGGGQTGARHSSENNHAILHNIIDFLDDENEKRDNRLLYYWKKVRRTLWTVLDNQHKSLAARIYTTISLTMIAVYISVFCLETIDDFRVPKRAGTSDYYYYSSASENGGGGGTGIIVSATSSYFYDTDQRPHGAAAGSSGQTTQSPLTYRSRTKPHAVLVLLDYLCMAFFTLELILHIAACPKPLKLFKSFLTWVDIATIIPLYFVMVFEAFAVEESTILIIELVKSIKILRILLIFKIANTFTGVRVLWYTFRASAKELVMLIFFLGIGVLFSGVLIYYAETMFGTRNSEFNSIPIGFWWGLVTMTTLGYGDFYPRTLPGYIVGASCAIIGVLVIALPIPVIVNNFTVYYAHAQALSSMPARPRVVLAASAARRLQTVQSSDDQSGGNRSQRTSIFATKQGSPIQPTARRTFRVGQKFSSNSTTNLPGVSMAAPHKAGSEISVNDQMLPHVVNNKRRTPSSASDITPRRHLNDDDDDDYDDEAAMMIRMPESLPLMPIVVNTVNEQDQEQGQQLSTTGDSCDSGNTNTNNTDDAGPSSSTYESNQGDNFEPTSLPPSSSSRLLPPSSLKTTMRQKPQQRRSVLLSRSPHNPLRPRERRRLTFAAIPDVEPDNDNVIT